MKQRLALLLFLALLAGPLAVLAHRRTAGHDHVPRLANFTLTDTEGRTVSLLDFHDRKAIVLVFIGTECPLANIYTARLRELHEEFSSRRVQFLAIDSHNQDTPARLRAYAREHEIRFPVLTDCERRVADQFGAERDCEAFMLRPNGVVCYHGRIDDQYGIGYQRPQPTRRDLAEALKELLAGRPVRVARTPVAGCLIGRPKTERQGDMTFTQDVAPILAKNCQACHRPGQIAPFALLTYRQTRDWADMIREVVQQRRMPPWNADPAYGKFANDRSLSARDRATLLAWIEQGCPKGDDTLLPPPTEPAPRSSWSVGTPDVVLSMKDAFTVPAKAPSGGVPYQYFWVPTNFTQDVWVQKAEIKAGDPSVVHHIVVSVGTLSQSVSDGGTDVPDFNLVAILLPGGNPTIYPPGMAKKIPRGAPLVFQVHYTANGVEHRDRSSIGLVLATEPPPHVIRTRLIYDHSLAIPPGDRHYKVAASGTLPHPVVLLNFLPHMHLRGQSFEYRAIYPDGHARILLSVPRYDFNWQTTYQSAEPLHLPAGTRIECTAYYDNSAQNPNNPDPTQTVRWGDQTWDEMMSGLFDYYELDESSPENARNASPADHHSPRSIASTGDTFLSTNR